MHVAGTISMPGIAIIEITGGRARWPPVRFGSGFFQGPFDGAVQAVIGHEITVAIVAGFIEPCQCTHQLVITAPERDGGMRGEAFHLIIDLVFDIVEEILAAGIEIAGEHEILPDQQAKTVAEIVEPVFLIEPAAPDADHVHIGLDRGAEKVFGLFPAGQRIKRIGGDPVGAAAEDFPAVDAEGEAAAGLVLVRQKLDGSEADLPGHGLIGQFHRQLVERLFATAGWPPEFRIFYEEDVTHHRFAGAHAAIEPEPFVIQRQIDRQARRTFGKQRDGDMQFHAAFDMVLRGDDMFDAGCIEALQQDFAVKAERGNRDIPVPAEMALRLAQHVAIGNRRIAGVIGNIKRLPRLPFRAGGDVGMEMDADGVFTRPHSPRNIRAVTAETIVGAQDRNVVDEDDGDGVEVIDIEIPAGIRLIENECALEDPVLLCDPLYRLLIGAVIGIWNDARIFERGVNIARYGKLGGVVSFHRGQAPGPGQIDDGFGRGRRNHNRTLHNMNSKKTGLHHGAGLCQNLGRMDARKAAASHLSGFAISSLRQRYRKTIVPSFL